MDVNLEELDQIIERGTHAPLSESESEKLKSALHALAGMLPATTLHRKDQERFGAAGDARAENDPETRLIKRRPRAQRGFRRTPARRKLRCRIPRMHAGRSLPGLRERQSLSAERTARRW